MPWDFETEVRIDCDEVLEYVKDNKDWFLDDEKVKELMLKTEAQMKTAFENSTLPDEPDQRLLEDLLIQIRESVYDGSNHSNTD